MTNNFLWSPINKNNLLTKFINYINKKDISAVIKTLQSNYLTTGPNTKIFERNFV